MCDSRWKTVTTTPPTQVRVTDAALNLRKLWRSVQAHPTPAKATFDATLPRPAYVEKMALEAPLRPPALRPISCTCGGLNRGSAGAVSASAGIEASLTKRCWISQAAMTRSLRTQWPAGLAWSLHDIPVQGRATDARLPRQSWTVPTSWDPNGWSLSGPLQIDGLRLAVWSRFRSGLSHRWFASVATAGGNPYIATSQPAAVAPPTATGRRLLL